MAGSADRALLCTALSAEGKSSAMARKAANRKPARNMRLELLTFRCVRFIAINFQCIALADIDEVQAVIAETAIANFKVFTARCHGFNLEGRTGGQDFTFDSTIAFGADDGENIIGFNQCYGLLCDDVAFFVALHRLELAVLECFCDIGIAAYAPGGAIDLNKTVIGAAIISRGWGCGRHHGDIEYNNEPTNG